MSNHNEEFWVKELCSKINKKYKNWLDENNLIIKDNVSLAYSINLNNMLVYRESERLLIDFDNIDNNVINDNVEKWNVDIFIGEKLDNKIIPRIIIEAKYKNINTHDPISYSYKAFLHKNLFNGLRYGLIVGNYGSDKENIYIPPRIVDYGDNFDFIFLLKNEFDNDEINYLMEIIKKSLDISRNLEKIDKYKKNDYTCIMKNIEFNPSFKE